MTSPSIAQVMRNMFSRRQLAVVLTVSCLVALVGCGDDDGDSTDASATGADPEAAEDDATADPYELTIVAEMTGPGSAGIFLSMTRGIQAAIEEANASGGVNGREIDVTVIDSQSTVDGATAATQEALSSDPLAMVYATISTSTNAVVPTLMGSDIPVIIGGVYDEAFYPQPAEYLFTSFPTNRQQVAGLLGGAERQLGSLEGKRVAVVMIQTAALDAQLAELERLADEVGYEIVAVERTEHTIADFSSPGANLADAKPDVVLVSLNPPSMAIVNEGLRVADVDVPIVASQTTSQESTFEALDNPKYFAFREVEVPAPGGELFEIADETGHSEGVESSFWTSGYVNGRILVEAIASCGTDCTRESLAAALEGVENLDVPGAFGTYSFGPERHHGATAVQYYVWDSESGAAVEHGDPVDISNA